MKTDSISIQNTSNTTQSNLYSNKNYHTDVNCELVSGCESDPDLVQILKSIKTASLDGLTIRIRLVDITLNPK